MKLKGACHSRGMNSAVFWISCMNHFVSLCVPLLMTWQSRRNESHVLRAGLNSAPGFHQCYALCSKVVQVTVIYMED